MAMKDVRSTPLTKRHFLTVALAGASLLLACTSEESTSPAPTAGDLLVSTLTRGQDAGVNEYTITVDGDQSQTVELNGTITFSQISTGSHQLELSGNPSHCAVDGKNPRQADVIGGAETVSAFLVNCFTDPMAFVSYRSGSAQIYAMEQNGSLQTNLSGTWPVEDEEPAWSPDGSRIAFVSDRAGDAEIYVMDLNGANQTQLTASTGSDRSPRWAPDGAQIAFVSDRDGDDDIYFMNADGSGQTALTGSADADMGPRWSPDGALIAFVSQRDGNDEIYVMDADGGNETRLTNNAALDADPQWSPDGQLIAFVTDRDGDFEIYTMSATGTNQTNRSNSEPEFDGQPRWSPSGQRIAFVSARRGNLDIYAMDSDGGNVSSVTRNPTDEGLVDGPVWSPDGSLIAFVGASPSSLIAEIFVTEPDGRNTRQLTRNGYVDVWPTWRP